MTFFMKFWTNTNVLLSWNTNVANVVIVCPGWNIKVNINKEHLDTLESTPDQDKLLWNIADEDSSKAI